MGVERSSHRSEEVLLVPASRTEARRKEISGSTMIWTHRAGETPVSADVVNRNGGATGLAQSSVSDSRGVDGMMVAEDEGPWGKADALQVMLLRETTRRRIGVADPDGRVRLCFDGSIGDGQLAILERL